jgi:surface antigen
LRKHKRVWTCYFVPLLACNVDALTSLQWWVVSFIQERKALSFVMSVSIIALLGGFILAPAPSSIIVVEKSQVLSQSICSSCASSNVSTQSDDKYQEPFVFPPVHRLTKTAPVTSTTVVSNKGATFSTQGSVNAFPYGSCTWWANQRYYQLHGIFVPWRTQSDAWQWTARAYQFGWYVSDEPAVGAIIDLQPGVQGASSWAGHVAVVERILSNGHVIASNMNWGARPWQVAYVEFAPGPGVTFIFR